MKNISNLGGEESSTARSRIGESMPDRRRDEDTAAIRVSNLSENVQDNDLQEVGFLNSLLLFHTNEEYLGQFISCYLFVWLKLLVRV